MSLATPTSTHRAPRFSAATTIKQTAKESYNLGLARYNAHDTAAAARHYLEAAEHGHL